jgi:hypothetical protein
VATATNPCNNGMRAVLSLTETIQHINEILNIVEVMHWIVIRSTSKKLEVNECEKRNYFIFPSTQNNKI